MERVTFITGNQKKADYLAKYLGIPVDHIKLDLDEIQSLELNEIVEHKVREAYSIIKVPVLVDDVSLEFIAFGRLPGPFIKFFLKEMSYDDICDMLNGKTREAIARSVYGYYDGKTLKLFEGELEGRIAEKPAGENGFGWDQIFIPNGYDVTRAQLDEKDDRETYLKLKPLQKIKKFLTKI
jgi:non-canonical purine NTP pyrophosphatase (RdgB/HAM1 family)